MIYCAITNAVSLHMITVPVKGLQKAERDGQKL